MKYKNGIRCSWINPGMKSLGPYGWWMTHLDQNGSKVEDSPCHPIGHPIHKDPIFSSVLDRITPNLLVQEVTWSYEIYRSTLFQSDWSSGVGTVERRFSGLKTPCSVYGTCSRPSFHFGWDQTISVSYTCSIDPLTNTVRGGSVGKWPHQTRTVPTPSKTPCQPIQKMEFLSGPRSCPVVNRYNCASTGSRITVTHTVEPPQSMPRNTYASWSVVVETEILIVFSGSRKGHLRLLLQL